MGVRISQGVPPVYYHKSYNDVVETCELFSYEELFDGSRVEVWLDKDCTWEAIWFARNDRLQPSTYYKKYKYD